MIISKTIWQHNGSNLPKNISQSCLTVAIIVLVIIAITDAKSKIKGFKSCSGIGSATSNGRITIKVNNVRRCSHNTNEVISPFKWFVVQEVVHDLVYANHRK